MTTQTTNQKDLYRTADLALAGAAFLFYRLEAIDRPPNSQKAFFLFKREDGLDKLIESYWRGEMKVEPQAYFNALRVIKARLYGND